MGDLRLTPVGSRCGWAALALVAVLSVGCDRTNGDQVQSEPPQEETGGQTASVLQQAYLGLSSGPLRKARLVSLPDGVLLRAGDVIITEDQVAEEITKADAQIRDQLRKESFFVLEQLAVRAVLLAQTRAWAREQAGGTSSEVEDALIQRYLESIAAKAEVSDEELRAFFDANPEMFGGATFDQVQSDLREYLTTEKRNEVVEAHINSLSERTPVEVSAAWVRKQAPSALDNPVDKARRSGLPTLADFGAEGCGPCDMMAPILAELQNQYAGQCNVLFVQVREEPILAARYGVKSIPVQVFFDREGEEVFRHVGFFPKDQMLAQLAQLGVK